MSRPALALALSMLVGLASAQTTLRPGQRPAGPGQSLTREQMWPAPTAEDWGRPCLITWQRTYEDAVAVAAETGQAILVCVNMDGEIASEHYAGIRYRQPEIAALYEPYVTVIASTYRHTPRDHEADGRRILCPRFGSVTCGEHISIEPVLFEKFLDNERVAPRHIGVEQDGSEMYDVYYAFDTDSVFDAIREGIDQRPPVDVPPLGDRSVVERVASPEVLDKQAVEAEFLAGERSVQLSLMRAARDVGRRASLDLLRLALKGHDAELARLARETLARSESPLAVDLIVEVLAEPLAEPERTELLAALDRLGEASPRARRLAVVHRGLAQRSSTLDVASWLGVLETADARPPSFDRDLFQGPLERQDEILASEDVRGHLELAEAFLQFAYEQQADDPESSGYLFLDAQRTARKAEQLGAYGWQVNAILSIASYYLDELPEAHARAIAAVESGLPADTRSWNTMAVLATFAQARQEAIRAALREGVDWPAEWVTDVHGVCLVLARHPHGTAEQVVAHHDFLVSLGAWGEASQILDESLKRYPDDWDLHDRLRRRILRTEGFRGLEPAYAAMFEAADASPNLPWFAGYASLVTAEFQRRTGRGGRTGGPGRTADENGAGGAGGASAALDTYARAIAFYEVDIAAHPATRDDADHFIAVALGGQARVHYETGDDAAAVQGLVRCFERRSASANALDGLNISAVDTARMVLRRLEAEARGELATRLQSALDTLDARLLELPAYERAPPSEDATRPRLPWRRRWQDGQ